CSGGDSVPGLPRCKAPGRAQCHSLMSRTLTALTATRTVSPTRMPSSSSESLVMTDSTWAPPAISTLTWHMTVPRLISTTLPSRRLRAPIFMAASPRGRPYSAPAAYGPGPEALFAMGGDLPSRFQRLRFRPARPRGDEPGRGRPGWSYGDNHAVAQAA